MHEHHNCVCNLYVFAVCYVCKGNILWDCCCIFGASDILPCNLNNIPSKQSMWINYVIFCQPSIQNVFQYVFFPLCSINNKSIHRRKIQQQKIKVCCCFVLLLFWIISLSMDGSLKCDDFATSLLFLFLKQMESVQLSE